MTNIELLRLRLNHLVTQARYDLYTLSGLNETPEKQQILQRLWDTLSNIHFISELLASQAGMSDHITQIQPSVPSGNTFNQLPNTVSQPSSDERTFTLEELAGYNGKNGRAAYVAVNGTVYDVTNNRTWAAATHFGLTAGKDYTAEFASCHAGQQAILATLPRVGRLIS
ncbi:cytochrome b5 [Bacillus sp. H-16]|uniref:cytochrome b5 domain-containing protein n=1 Tax=Alteribacter salitolerans TaxID=2912333 RepID=UPI0019660996|nr:cytochrome b5 domain-containing protein [Alteribacter salitolerans]MBM7096736.1 cytochrome b5 [Alteribacter salitolerans]